MSWIKIKKLELRLIHAKSIIQGSEILYIDYRDHNLTNKPNDTNLHWFSPQFSHARIIFNVHIEGSIC